MTWSIPGTLQHSAPITNSSRLGPVGGGSKMMPACFKMIAIPNVKVRVSRAYVAQPGVFTHRQPFTVIYGAHLSWSMAVYAEVGGVRRSLISARSERTHPRSRPR